MTYNAKVLSDLLRARSLTPALLSQRLGMKPERLRDELRREPEPKQAILQAIARDLALPPFVFYMKEAPPLHDVLPDFRSEAPKPSPKSRETIEAIQLAEGIQKTMSATGASPADHLPTFSGTSSSEVAAFALEMRNFLSVTVSDQQNASDAKAFYNICRKRIEDKGIFVLQESFPAADGSGFCLADARYPVIVVNTKQQSRGRRLFTLIHELGHVLMGQSGISDPFIRQNRIERLCNSFAANFLVPKLYAQQLLRRPISRNPTTDEVRLIAGWLKISQEATVLRLQDLGFFEQGSYDTWKSQFSNSGENPDFSDKGGGAGGAPPQEKVKLAKYGFRLALASDLLLRDQRVSEIELYRFTGIKPKYLHAYIAYAKELTTADLRTLDLDDA